MSALAIVNDKGDTFHKAGCGCSSTGHKKGCHLYGSGGPPKAAHSGADPLHEVLHNWREILMDENEALYTDRWELVAKSRAMGRNHSMLVGALNHKADAIVGTHFRVKPRVNWKRLGWTRDEAVEVEQQLKVVLKDDYYGREKYIDARRTRNLTQGAAAVLVSEMVNGDWMTKMEFLKNEKDRPFGTAFNLVDPMRCYSPAGRVYENNRNLYHGVIKNKGGMPVGYFLHDHIKGHHKLRRRQGQGFDKVRDTNFKKYPRWSKTGRPIFLHGFDTRYDVEALRGRPIVTSALVPMKGSDTLQSATLQHSIVQSLIFAVITSSMPDVKDILGPDPNAPEGHSNAVSEATNYMNEAKSWLPETGITIGQEGQVPRLYPNEKLELMAPHTPFSSFDTFQQTFHAMNARGLNMGFAEYTGQYDRLSYSAARAQLLSTWRDLNARREHTCADWASGVHCCYTEESFEEARILYPKSIRASMFHVRKRREYWKNNKQSLYGAEYFGPGREEVDPVKGATSNAINSDYGWLTDTDKLNLDGKDFDEVCEEREYELSRKLRIAQLKSEIQGIESQLGEGNTTTGADTNYIIAESRRQAVMEQPD